MKLTLKIVIALIVFATAVITYAEIPDVSKWSCPNASVGDIRNYGVVITDCENDGTGSFYVKVSGELIYIHERRTDANKTIYYNALKTDGRWVEVVNKKDLTFGARQTKNKDIEVSIADDNGIVVAKRIVPLLKK